MTTNRTKEALSNTRERRWIARERSMDTPVTMELRRDFRHRSGADYPTTRTVQGFPNQGKLE